jgi:hypothetical protein
VDHSKQRERVEGRGGVRDLQDSITVHNGAAGIGEFEVTCSSVVQG